MIEITPAILEKDIKDVKKLLAKYKDFNEIDIDICEEAFVGNNTVSTKELVENIDLREEQSIGIHLMTVDPSNDLELLRSKYAGNHIRIYLHQESDLSGIADFEWPDKWIKCVVINIDSRLKDINFYNQFNEVSFMSVEAGGQGNEFRIEVIDKIDRLLEMGYNGKVSIDGSVNLKTASIIKDFPIDRVSSGSYFKNSTDAKLAKMKLDLALNMKAEE